MAEKWHRLQYTDLQKILAQDELDKLEQMSISSNVSAVCEQITDSCADAFRYSWQSKGYAIDVRQHYIPTGYDIYVLNYARPQIWSRFPNSKDIAIDEIREKLFDEAKEVLKDAYVGVPEPDYSDDPELSSKTIVNLDASLTLPWQRMITRPGCYGFNAPYVKNYQLSGIGAWY